MLTPPPLCFKKQFILHRLADNDSDVKDERARISGGSANDLIVVRDLTKVFKSESGPKTAVDHLSFGIPSGQCFGLLGVNGAGKTTTFSMLTGEISPSEGTAIMDGYNVRTHLKEAQQRMGYCPQFDALLDQMTGRELLDLFARLRGIRSEDRSITVQELIERMDLAQYADLPSYTYSGGNKVGLDGLCGGVSLSVS